MCELKRRRRSCNFETTVGRDDETFSCLVKILALKKVKEKKRVWNRKQIKGT